MNYFCCKFRIVSRAKRIAHLRKKIPPYLKGDFTIELNYKLWITKGARFEASSRTKKIHELSSKTIGYLSAYLIIVNLLNVYNVDFITKLSNEYLAFTSTALSILILIFSQFESARNCNILSDKYHQCATEIGILYNRLRYVKTFHTFEHNREEEILIISKEYDQLLKKFENHEQIDTESFKISKPDYFDLSFLYIWSVIVKRYFLSFFKYHLFMYGPVVLFVYYQVYK